MGWKEGGQVRHVWKDTLFVRVKSKTDNAGVVAVAAAAVAVATGDRIFRAPRPLSRGQKFFNSASRGGGAAAAGRGGGFRFGRRRDPLLGKQVKVQKGKYKGIIANVRAVERDELT